MNLLMMGIQKITHMHRFDGLGILGVKVTRRKIHLQRRRYSDE